MTKSKSLLLPLVYFGWWWFNRKISLLERGWVFLLVVGGAFVAKPFQHMSAIDLAELQMVKRFAVLEQVPLALLEA